MKIEFPNIDENNCSDTTKKILVLLRVENMNTNSFRIPERFMKFFIMNSANFISSTPENSKYFFYIRSDSNGLVNQRFFSPSKSASWVNTKDCSSYHFFYNYIYLIENNWIARDKQEKMIIREIFQLMNNFESLDNTL